MIQTRQQWQNILYCYQALVLSRQSEQPEKGSYTQCLSRVRGVASIGTVVVTVSAAKCFGHYLPVIPDESVHELGTGASQFFLVTFCQDLFHATSKLVMLWNTCIQKSKLWGSSDLLVLVKFCETFQLNR